MLVPAGVGLAAAGRADVGGHVGILAQVERFIKEVGRGRALDDEAVSPVGGGVAGDLDRDLARAQVEGLKAMVKVVDAPGAMVPLGACVILKSTGT